MRTYSRILALFTTLAGLVATAPTALALTATGNFDVTVNLFPKCEVTSPSSSLSLSYVSFQTSASTNSANFSIRCTNTLPYTLSLTGTSPTGGTLAGLAYTLSLPNTAGTGNGTTQTVSVVGSVAPNQSGSCSTVQTSTTGTQAASTTGANTGGAVGTQCIEISASGAHVLTVTY